MFVNGRIVVEEGTEKEFGRELVKKIENFLTTDERFSKFKFTVDVEWEWECWSDQTNCFWNECNVVIINHDVDVTFKNGTSKAMTHFGFSTEMLEPQLVHIDGEFKFFYVYSCGSYSITNAVSFQNNHNDGSFEDIIEELFV